MRTSRQQGQTVRLDVRNRVLGAVRQSRYPKEFRIAPPVLAPDLRRAIEGIAATEVSPADYTEAGEPGGTAASSRVLASVATGLWRVRQTMLEPGTDQPLTEMRRGYRHLESTWDALAEAGVEIQDHLDMLFDSGLALKVIAFQPTPGIDRERVIETIKPSVYVDGSSIQMGEVIVGTPEEPRAGEETPSDKGLPRTPQPETEDHT